MRRILIFVMVLILSVPSLYSSAYGQDPCPCDCIKYGDLNGDGRVNVTDLAILSNYMAGNTHLTTIQKGAADVCKDGVINVQDLYVLANFLAGNITQLPVVPQ